MDKWTQEFHDYWKSNCSNNSFDLPMQVNQAILIFLNQIEYLSHLISNHSLITNSQKNLSQNLSTKDDIYIKQIALLKSKITKLEKRIEKLEPPKLPMPIFYENGKPTRKKPTRKKPR